MLLQAELQQVYIQEGCILNCNMAAPDITLAGTDLTTEITKGNKQWVARIAGTDPQYDFDREFVSPYGRGTKTVTVEDGDVIERAYFSHGGREKPRVYWIVHEGDLVEIDQDDVEDALENPQAYYPEPETHECEECGDEFDSSHGLAIHAGMMHSDEPATETEPTVEPTPEIDQQPAAPTLATDGGEAVDEPEDNKHEAEDQLDPEDVELEPGQVYVRGPWAKPPARAEVVETDGNVHGYEVRLFDEHDTHQRTLSPSVHKGPGRILTTIADIKQWIADGKLKLVDADPGELPPSAQDEVDAFLDDERARIDEDGVAFNPNIFSRWQKHGHDRLYVVDPGEGWIGLTPESPLVGEDLIHPDPAHNIGGKRMWVNVDGGKALFASDGASHDWVIAFVPDAVREDDGTDDEQAKTDGGESPEPTPPHIDDFEQPSERKSIYEVEDADGVAGGVESYFPGDALDPEVPYFYVGTRDHGAFDLNIGIERDDQPDAWRDYLGDYPREGAGLDVGELQVWHRPPMGSDEDSHVRDRYTLDGRTIVETGESIEEFAKSLLHEVTGIDRDDEGQDDGDDPEVRTDGGVVAADGGELDWDKVAGGKPSRNGTRRIVTPDEAQTPYGDSKTFRDEFVGLDMEVGTSFSSDTITHVNVQPQIPKRARSAAAVGWIARLGVREGDLDSLYEGTDVDEPLSGYQPETTEDYREADPEDPRGDGVYARDNADSPLTAQIADVVTREGGRIPVDFSAAVQNEGYARSRNWRVYAPESNPYHVAAAVTDLLQDTDGVSEVRVTVENWTAAGIARKLRANGIGFAFDYVDSEEGELIERVLREWRWSSGLPDGQRYMLQAAPTEARQRFRAADFDGDSLRQMSDPTGDLQRLYQHPGDAWDYHEVTIHIDEEAKEAFYG